MGEAVDNPWFLAALWVGLALVATLVAIWFRISTALSEIVVGTVAQLIIGVAIGGAGLGAQTPWVGFLAGTGAIVLTFLAGAELDPSIFRTKWKEATVVGLAGFFAPFLGSAAIAYYVLGWDLMPSWLAGVALSTTSVAVVYAVMLELGFNTTEYGKAILAACFINDLGTVIGPRPHLRALHDPHADLRRRLDRRVRHAPVRHAQLLSPLRRPRVGARNKIHPVDPVRHGRGRALGG
jgi:Kef-type K+ transport system membrane component KefB